MKKAVFIVVVFLQFIACVPEREKQREWITEDLGWYMWSAIYDVALENEASHLNELIQSNAEDVVSSYESWNQATNQFASQIARAFLGDFVDIYDSAADKQRDRLINKYHDNVDNVSRKLIDAVHLQGDRINEELRLELRLRRLFEEEPVVDDFQIRQLVDSLQLFDIDVYDDFWRALIGTPEKIISPPDSVISQIGFCYAVRALVGIKMPVVTSCKYSKKMDLWVVRVDNADNQFVKL